MSTTPVMIELEILIVQLLTGYCLTRSVPRVIPRLSRGLCSTASQGQPLGRASCEVTGVLYRGGGDNFGDIDCQSLHLGPGIDATHTLMTATFVPTTTMSR